MKINIKSILKTLSAVSILALVSCSQINVQREESSYGFVQNEDSAQTSLLKINLDRSFRTINPDIELSDLTDFKLTGSWVNGDDHTENETIYEWENYNAFSHENNIPVKIGTWTFKLTAKKGSTVYSATTDKSEIYIYSNNYISFNLKRVTDSGEGNGTLDLTFKWYHYDEDYRNPKKVTVTIKKDNAAESVVSTENLSVTEEDQIKINKSLPKGSYILNADFYAKDGNSDVYITTWSELVNIAADHTSTAERDIVIDGVCSINWNLRDNDESQWKAGTVIPLTFSQKEGITLPDTSSISREGYFFYGWVANDYYDKKLVTELSPGTTDITIYASWGKINPVPQEDGIRLDMILPENTYDIRLYRYDVEKNADMCIWEYDRGSMNPLSETTYSLTDRFTEQGKTYYYYYSVSYLKNGSSYNSTPESWMSKNVVAINPTRIPQVTSVPSNITVDTINDTLVYNGNITYSNFDNLSGYVKKTDVVYKTKGEYWNTANFDLNGKSYKSLFTEYGWQNYEVEPYRIQLYYVSDDGKAFWYFPEDTSFANKFPSFRISATEDHTILAVDKTENGHELTVFIPAGTKKVDLGFCTIGNGQSVISQTDTTVTVLNKYESPEFPNTITYQAYYTDSSSKVTEGCSTSWIGALEESSCKSKPELTSNISAHFDEETNSILLDELPQVDFKGQEPDDWGIDLVYYFGSNSNYKIAARYTDGNAISVPLEFTQDVDSLHALFNDENGSYDFYKSYGYIRIPALQDEASIGGVNYTVQFINECFYPNDFQMHKKYTVTFDPDNGSAVTTQKVNHGSYAQRPATDPSKENYIFGGWTLEGEVGRFDFANTEINSDITLKALWLTDSAPSYSVTITVDQPDMPMEYTNDEENKEIRFKFPYYAHIYLNGEKIKECWYNWTFEYKNLPRGYYTIDFIEPNEWDKLPGERYIDYSYTIHVQIQ